MSRRRIDSRNGRELVDDPDKFRARRVGDERRHVAGDDVLQRVLELRIVTAPTGTGPPRAVTARLLRLSLVLERLGDFDRFLAAELLERREAIVDGGKVRRRCRRLDRGILVHYGFLL